ncbi:MAG TPA: PilN domain-containing protein [Longimicrobium sp.]|uniref:PilN domain-containing protein n=1 Tax=Longimicrobium sp. TaxID=2029185 RepID=UPI002EDAAD95
MIEINLLPSGTQRRPAAPRRAGAGPSLPALGADPRVAGMGGAAVLLALLGAYWFWTSGQSRSQLQAQVETEAADSVRLERTIALMKTLDTRRDTIDRKMEVIRQVDTRRYVWPHLMDEVSRATPPFMWLTKLAVVEDETAPPAPTPAPAPAAAAADTAKQRADSAAAAAAPPVPAGPVFNLEGHAATPEALTRFMKNLEASPMIREVSLVTSERQDVQGRTLFQFTLEARWEEPDSAFVETVPLLTVR